MSDNNLSLKYIYGSDYIGTVIEKINFNFDQILNFGGGPAGKEGKEGNQGIPGSTGKKGVKGDKGDKGSLIHYTSDTLNDGDIVTDTDISEGDLIIDGNGGYFIAENDGGTLKYVFKFNINLASVFQYIETEAIYQSTGNPIDKWVLKAGGVTGKERNLVLVKRIGGVSNDTSEFYRLLLGADEYPSSQNATLTLTNIIPDGGGVTDALDAFYAHIAFKFRPDSASNPSFNTAYIYYIEDSGTSVNTLNIENGSAAYALVDDTLNTKVFAIAKGNEWRFVGEYTDYVGPTNLIGMSLQSGTEATLYTNGNLTLKILGGVLKPEFDFVDLAATIQIRPLDGIYLTPSASLITNVPLNISSDLVYSAQALISPSGGVADLENPTQNSLGFRSAFYTFSNAGLGLDVLAGLANGVANQIVTIYFSTVTRVACSSSFKTMNVPTGQYDTFEIGETLTMTTNDGTNWYQIGQNKSDFIARAITSTDFNNLTLGGYTVIPAGGSTNASAIKDLAGISTMRNINYQTKQNSTSVMQMQMIGDHATITPISDKINPVYVRRKQNTYYSKWNKLLSEYGGNNIHDLQNILGATRYNCKEVILNSQIVNGQDTYAIPDTILKTDDSSATFYSIRMALQNIALSPGSTVSSDYKILLPQITLSSQEVGRMIWLDLGRQEPPPGPLSNFTGYKPFSISINNPWYPGPAQGPYIDLYNWAPDGTSQYNPRYYTVSCLSLWLCVPSGNTTYAWVSGQYNVSSRWICLWSTENDIFGRWLPGTNNF